MAQNKQEQDRLRSIAAQQKGGITVIKSKESSSIKGFLKKKEDQADIDALKKKYFDSGKKDIPYTAENNTAAQFNKW